MSTTSMPWFSAHASLYRSNTNYSADAASHRFKETVSHQS
jgi:hypothetical protein